LNRLKIALKAVLKPAQVCARSSKFSLFDPAKEMAYIQMSRKEKSKGKAAVDLIGSQVQNSLTAESSLREEPVPMQ
jgi:ATP/ADP translocase